MDDSTFFEEQPIGPNQIRWFAVTVGAKLYSNPINKETHWSNINSTDLKLVYFQKDGKTINDKTKHQKFHQLFPNTFSGTYENLGGMLRIHLELPHVIFTEKVNTVETNNRDVSLQINYTNMNTFIKDKESLEVLAIAINNN